VIKKGKTVVKQVMYPVKSFSGSLSSSSLSLSFFLSREGGKLIGAPRGKGPRC